MAFWVWMHILSIKTLLKHKKVPKFKFGSTANQMQVAVSQLPIEKQVWYLVELTLIGRTSHCCCLGHSFSFVACTKSLWGGVLSVQQFSRVKRRCPNSRRRRILRIFAPRCEIGEWMTYVLFALLPLPKKKPKKRVLLTCKRKDFVRRWKLAHGCAEDEDSWSKHLQMHPPSEKENL